MGRHWIAALLLGLAPAASLADDQPTVHLDYADYNPLSLVLRDKHWVEDVLGPDIKVEWALSPRTTRALDRLSVRSLDLGSASGSEALLARANGVAVKIVYVYAKPEWTALLSRPQSGIRTIADLKGKRVAAGRGTEPGVFLHRALADAGLAESDITLVPMQAQDGRIAFDKGEVDAWAGFDPFMAEAELETHDQLFFRHPDWNSSGVLVVRDNYLKDHSDIVAKIIAAYERARNWALANRSDVAQTMVAVAKLSPTVVARQLARTDLTHPAVDAGLRKTLTDVEATLQTTGGVPDGTDFDQVLNTLLDPDFTKNLPQN